WVSELNGEWNPAAGTVGVTPQAFGPSAGTAGVVGAEDVIAYSGSDGDLYEQTRTGMNWSPRSAHGVPGTITMTPTIVSLASGGAMIVFVRNDQTIGFT